MSISTAWNPSPTPTRCATPWPRPAAEGPLMLHFHEAVGHDGAGRIEAAIAYAGHLEPSGELSLRLRPAGREAYLPAPAALQTYPQVLRLYDAIERWLEEPVLLRRQSLRNPPGHRRRPLRCRLPHRTLRLHAAPALHRLRPCYANSFAMMFGEHAPPRRHRIRHGQSVRHADARGALPLFDPHGWNPDAGLTARWRRWVGVRTAVAAAARARRRNDCTTRWRMVLPGSVRSRWDTSGISLA